MKDYMLTYRRLDHFEVIEYSNSNFAGWLDSSKSKFCYLFLLVGGAISWKKFEVSDHCCFNYGS